MAPIQLKSGGNLAYAPVGALGSLAGPGGKAASRGARWTT